ncbi:hypothetical protein SteCoe_382 [Stentor coeruleus]|uniref:Cyclic nucleotide-binding domain-containing protein n=1 Tax=Stentor coeruleus TaxID=5963 RepID=A0A1R2D415_9CILI|nr:hypothetical protein SteCoe_382 [Stentor coeruleus]
MDSKLSILKAILSKDKTDRDATDLRAISSLIANVKFFESLKHFKSTFKEVCINLTYEFFEKSKYIFREGEYGDKFFILIQGEAGVLITIKEKGENIIKEVLVYRDGAGFGELALTDRKPRAASILAKSDCHLAVLDKQSYNRILASLLKQKRMEFIDFLQTQALFKTWTRGSLLKLSYCFEEKTYKKGRIIYMEDQIMDYLYLLREGEVKISKNIKIGFIEKSDILSRAAVHLKKIYRHKADMSILSQGEWVGINDIDNSTYTSTCTCISNEAKMLMISKQDFKQRLNNAESQNIINTDKFLRNSIHENSINSITKIIKERISSPYKKLFLEKSNDKISTSDIKKYGEKRYSLVKPKRALIIQKTNRKNIKICSDEEDEVHINRNLDSTLKKDNRDYSFIMNEKGANSQRARTSIPKSRLGSSDKRPTSCNAKLEKRCSNQNYNKTLTTSEMTQKFELNESLNFNTPRVQTQQDMKIEKFNLLLAHIQPLGRLKKKKAEAKTDEEFKNIHVIKKNKTFRKNNPTNWSFRSIKISPKSFIISQDVI